MRKQLAFFNDLLMKNNRFWLHFGTLKLSPKLKNRFLHFDLEVLSSTDRSLMKFAPIFN